MKTTATTSHSASALSSSARTRPGRDAEPDLAKSDANVPQVHYLFHDNERMAYVVMEHIDLVQVSAETLAPKAA